MRSPSYIDRPTHPTRPRFRVWQLSQTHPRKNPPPSRSNKKQKNSPLASSNRHSYLELCALPPRGEQIDRDVCRRYHSTNPGKCLPQFLTPDIHAAPPRPPTNQAQTVPHPPLVSPCSPLRREPSLPRAAPPSLSSPTAPAPPGAAPPSARSSTSGRRSRRRAGRISVGDPPPRRPRPARGRPPGRGRSGRRGASRGARPSDPGGVPAAKKRRIGKTGGCDGWDVCQAER